MTQIPAAWYPDPAGSGQQRYWDGAAWTNHLRVPEPVAPQFPPPQVAAPQYAAPQFVPQQAAAPVQPTQPERPNPYGNPFAAAATSDNPFAAYASSLTNNQVAGGVDVLSGAFGNNRQSGIGGAIALLAVGIVALLASGFVTGLLDSASTPAAGSVSATGHIVSFDMNDGGCSPVVEFTADGQTYTVNSMVSQQPCPFSLGDAAELTYLPSSPASTAKLASDASTAGLFKVIYYVVTGLMLVGGAVLLVSRIMQISRGASAWKAR